MLWLNVLFCTAQMAETFVLNTCLTDSIEYNSIPIINTRNLSNHILHKNISASSTINALYLKTPSIENQGSQGSCTAWAFGYAGMSILAYDKFEDWNKANRSPSYLFYKSKSNVYQDCTIGVTMIQVANAAVTYGCCSMFLMPYDQDNCTIAPSNIQNFDAILNRLSYGRLESTIDVDSYKQSLYAGYPIVVNFAVYKSFDDMWNTNGIWQNNDPIALRGYHAACVVGYDDTKQMFKVQNSWGNGGDLGYFWVTYSLIEKGCFNEAYVLFNITDDDYPEIQGPSQFCDTAVYTLENVPAGATIEWKYSPNTMRSSALRIVRGQGSASATFRRGFIMNGNIVKPPKPIGGTVMKAGDGISKPFSGAATVMATVTMNNGTSYTVSKAVTLPPLAATETPVVTGWNNSLWYVDISHTLYVGNCDSVPDDRIVWEVHLPGRSEPISHVGRSVTFKPTTSGTVTVIVANTESCSASNRDTLTHTVRFKPIISYANPVRTAGTVEISVSVEEQTADFATVTVPYDGEYTLELWSELYGRVRTVEADAATVQIPLSGLNAGTYFLKLIINNEPITTQQLIIK